MSNIDSKRVIIFAIIIFLLMGFLAIYYFALAPAMKIGQYDAFAQCLRTKGVKMYGAYWCGHCQNQKEKFGSSFKYIEYIECSQEGNPRAVNPICTNQNISGYPTWEFSNGTRLAGEQTFEKLSEVSGCPIK